MRPVLIFLPANNGLITTSHHLELPQLNTSKDQSYRLDTNGVSHFVKRRTCHHHQVGVGQKMMGFGCHTGRQQHLQQHRVRNWSSVDVESTVLASVNALNQDCLAVLSVVVTAQKIRSAESQCKWIFIQKVCISEISCACAVRLHVKFVQNVYYGYGES